MSAGAFPARFLWRQARREARGLLGKGALFVLCLATGVAAVVAVAGIADGLERGLRARSREFLAADVAVRGRAEIPEAVLAVARDLPGARLAQVTQVFSMVAADGPAGPTRSRLADVKAVDPGWPFYGAVTTDPPLPLADLLREDSVLVAPELARGLGLAPGNRLRLGERAFTVAGFVLDEPDQPIGRIGLAPRVLLSRAALETTGLLGPGSRKEHALLVATGSRAGEPGPGEAKRRLGEALDASLRFRIESHEDAQPQLREEIARAEQFLGLVALLSLVIGGAGIAQAARAWMRSRIEAIALLRCLGLRPVDVLVLYVALSLALGLAGSAAGIAAGMGVTWLAPLLLRDLADGVAVGAIQPGAVLRGITLGLATALAFSVPTLLEMLRISPLRALRSSVEPAPPGWRARGIVILTFVTFGLIAARVQAGRWLEAALVAGALTVTAAILMLAARLLSRQVARLARGAAWMRLALGAAARPGSGVISATTALGLGVLVVLSVVLVQLGLRQELMARLPAGAPSAFLLDVQPAQWPGIRAALESGGATDIASTPMVMARLSAIDGQDVSDLAAGKEDRSRWALTREQRLTWWDEPPAGNAITQGALWSLPGEAEVSVEEGFAEELGIGLGSQLVLDVQGVPVTLRVSSLRSVEWRTFRINFFLVAEPGSLDGAPQQVLAAARLPEGGDGAVQDAIVALAPNVTLIPIREALLRVERFVARLMAGVNAVGGFTVIAGLAILAGAVLAGASGRGARVALLKTLGMTRREIGAMLLVEHAVVGVVAALIGATGALALSWVILARIMELPWHARPGVVAVAVLATTALAATCGALASRGALNRRPIEVLRREA